MCGWQVQADDEATAEPEAFAVRAELARLVQEVEDVKASHVLELADAEARSAATLQVCLLCSDLWIASSVPPRLHV